ncbi:MAG TPA: hypothetical protein VHY48_12120 [Acidobacteriaceae bacterium]|jgi:hypothetical protein|nr:hypothetical protein [Acidobacteriaceae bacterium]
MEDLQQWIAEAPESLRRSLEGGQHFGVATADQKTSEARLVQKALFSLLESVPFRSSKQCQDLLRYVVEQSLANQDNLLRERVIGAAVFGRAPDYDTANDPIVRARMAEVRKRLAQYYQDPRTDPSPVRIEVLPGHYRAHFRSTLDTARTALEDQAADSHEPDPGNIAALPTPSMAPEIAAAPVLLPAAQERSRAGFGVLALLLLSGLLVAGAGVYAFEMLHPVKQTAFEQFWEPVLKSSMPVIIYTGTNVVYRFSPEFLNQYTRMHHLQNNGPEFAVDLKTMGPIDARNLTVSNNAYVTTGDVSACASISSMLVQYKKPYELRFAGDISPGDLHSAPIVLIGAFNNPWTLNITNPLRFTFAGGDMIKDRFNPSRSWNVNVKPNGDTTDDYAIVSRLVNAEQGETMMTAAGIGQYGTQAASEFLSSPERINSFARNEPAGWSSKNLQIVMHVKVVDNVPASENIVAIYQW